MLGYLVFLGAFATVLAAVLYIRSMFRGGAKPNRVTWFMWSIAPFIASAAAVSNGVGWAVLPVLMSGVSPFLIFTASLYYKRAYWKLTTFDYTCGILSVLALLLWYLTQNPNLAIIFAIVSDGFAAIPTVKKPGDIPRVSRLGHS